MNTNSAILSIMIIGILVIPVMGLSYVEDYKRDLILDLGSNTYQSEFFEPIYINSSLVESIFSHPSTTITGNSTNAQAISLEDKGMYFNVHYEQNCIMYIGNNTYHIDYTTFTFTDIVLIPTNITMHNLTQYDVITSISESNAFSVIGFDSITDDDRYTIEGYFTSFNPTTLQQIIDTTDKLLIPIGVDDSNVWLTSTPNIDDNTFSISSKSVYNELTTTIDDTTMYYIILTATIILSAVTFIFMTNMIDIVYDDSKNKWRK